MRRWEAPCPAPAEHQPALGFPCSHLKTKRLGLIKCFSNFFSLWLWPPRGNLPWKVFQDREQTRTDVLDAAELGPEGRAGTCCSSPHPTPRQPQDTSGTTRFWRT